MADDQDNQLFSVTSQRWGHSTIVRLLHEPLVLFLLSGAAIFALYSLQPSTDTSTSPNVDASSYANGLTSASLREIRITDDVLAMLRSSAAFYDGSEPSSEKLERLIARWVDEEMIFRHAVSQDLHLSDSRTRAHLVETMSALWVGAPDEPDHDTVLAHYMDNLSDYYSEPSFSLSHLFLRDEPPAPATTLRRLRAGEPVEGDEFWAGTELTDYAESALKSTLGGAFHTALAGATPGEWQGPIRSAQGYHFVRLHSVRKPTPRRLDEVYATVRADVMNAQRERRIREQLDRIASSFAIVRQATDTNGG